MKCSDISAWLLAASITLVTACGGGGGSSSPAPTPAPAQNPAPTPTPTNATPVAVSDSFEVTINTGTTIDVLANDSDSDLNSTLSVTIVTAPSNGTISGSNSNIRYQPAAGFTGPDSFQYQVTDNAGAVSETADVAITVVPITNTSLSILTLSVPDTGYTSQNNTELSATVLVSPQISFSVAPNPVSFSVALIGNSVNDSANNLFIAELVRPDGTVVSPLKREVTFCDPGYCSGLLPRKPSQTIDTGVWQLRIGTLADTVNPLDLSSLELIVAQRTGPSQQTATTSTLRVRPFLTASSISIADAQLVLTRLQAMAQSNGISLQTDPLVALNNPQFTEVSRNFSDSNTSQLVQMGSVDRVNLFFIEDFSGAGASGLLGISGGLPGPFGQTSEFNGVLINASAFRNQSDENYARNTAEIALHEMGHFLGLYHTTERQFDLHDVIEDTPECTTASDRNGAGVRGVADIDECSDGQNLMFWNTDFSGNKTPLSDDQRHVIINSPIAIPAT